MADFGNTDLTNISQPQTTRINSRLRAPRSSELLNLEVYSMAHDIYKLYYKQDVIESAFLDNVNWLDDPSAGHPDDVTFTISLISMADLLGRVSALDKRLTKVELGERNEL